MKSSTYWRQRFLQIEQSQNQTGMQCYANIERQYRQAQRQIESQLEVWYQRFADNNGVTMAEARRMLTARELEELKWDVRNYIKYGEENAINQQWMKQLENASARYHISRLEALKLQTQQQLEVMFGNQLDSIDSAMRDIYLQGYYHTAYEIQKGVGIGWNFATLDERRISKVINNPWAVDGKNFSERIWSNRQRLVNELNTELTRNIILGQDPQKAIDAIAKRMNVSKNNAGRLVMTEEAFFSAAAQKDCFDELDVEQFEIVATLDSHTSDLCREMDGKVFPMSQWEVGVTAPPFHVWCRSTTVPAFGDEFDNIGERAARGEDGKTYYVPADMTYKEWQQAFVDGDMSGLQEVSDNGTIKSESTKAVSISDAQTFEELRQYMKQNYDIEILDSVDELDFQSVKEGVSGIEHIMLEFPQAGSSYKTISTEKRGLMSAGYNGDISFNPGHYKTRESALMAHGIGERIKPGGMHPKGNNCFGSGCHEAGHILEKALADRANGGECVLSEMNWRDSTYARAIVSEACRAAKKRLECRGMTNNQLKDAISAYAGYRSRYSASETMAEAVCDYSINSEDAAPLSKEIWRLLKKELG